MLSNYISADKHYAHEHQICEGCGMHMHTKRAYNKKPIVKFINPNENK